MPYIGKEPAKVPVTAADIPDNSITAAKIVDGAITISDIADDAVTADKLANSINTEITANTAKVTNATHSGEVTGATALTIADNVVDEANLKISNSPTNGQFLSAQSGNTGGLTWAAVPAGVGGATGVDFNDNVAVRLGTGNDLKIIHDGSHSKILNYTGDLHLASDNKIAILGGSDTAETCAEFNDNGAVNLYYDHSKKFETIAAGIQVTGDLVISGNIDIADGSYFKGGSAGYRFNDALDTINCLIIRDNGDIHYGTSNDAPWNLTGNITPSAFWDKTNGQQWFAANDTFPLALNRCNGTGVIERFYYNGSVTGDISTTSSGVSYNTSSDYRLKENVDYTWDATTRLKQLKPARFNFIADDTNTLVDGFIAHEVESIVPEAVNGTKDAMQDEEYVITPAVEDSNGNITKEAVKGTRSVIDPQGIDQSKLVPLLVKAMQEQQTTIESLTARITALEG